MNSCFDSGLIVGYKDDGKINRTKQTHNQDPVVVVVFVDQRMISIHSIIFFPFPLQLFLHLIRKFPGIESDPTLTFLFVHGTSI